MFATASTGYCPPQEQVVISNISPLAEAREHYRTLETRLKDLQEKRFNIEKDFTLSRAHPELYSTPRGQEYLARARERRPKLLQEIDDVMKQQRSLLRDFPALEKQLRAELYGNGQADSLGGDGEEKTPQVQVLRAKGDQPDPWPELAEDALHGLAGDLVRAIDQYTEADPVAVLVTLLVMFGTVRNAGAHFLIEYTRRLLRLFVTMVVKTAN